MRARQANKIQKQVSPPETSNKWRKYWEKYKRSQVYSDKLYRRLFRKMKKEGRLKILSYEEIDQIYGNVMDEFNTDIT